MPINFWYADIRNFDVDLDIPPGLTIDLDNPLVSYQIPFDKKAHVTRLSATLEPTIKPGELRMVMYACFQLPGAEHAMNTRIFRVNSDNHREITDNENVYPYLVPSGATVSIYAQNLDTAGLTRSIEADFQILEFGSDNC